MDVLLIGAGTRLFLPAFRDGGMVYFGDVHAAMGDGEVFLSGVEIAGRIQARITVTARWSVPTQTIVTGEWVAVMAVRATFDQAAEAAKGKAAPYTSGD